MNLKELTELNNSSSYAHLLGITIEIPEPGRCIASMKVNEHILNFMGKPHGAAIFSLADQAFAAAYNSLGRPAVALQMSINFISSPVLGETIVAEAEQKHSGKSTSVYQADVKDQRGNLIATCSAMAYYLKNSNAP